MAVKSDIAAEIAFILALFHWMKPLTGEGGEKSGVPERTPNNKYKKLPHTRLGNFKPQARLEPALYRW